MKKSVLIIDDEPGIRESLSGILEDEGFSPFSAENAEQGLKILAEERVDLVLLDIWLGEGMDGMSALHHIKSTYNLPVIMISGHGTIETAVQAVQSGAQDFIEKPLSYDKVIISIGAGLRVAQLEQDNQLLRERAVKKSSITGESQAIRELRTQIETVAPTDSWVLIRGDHGTGKELVAQTIHQLSKCSHRPMIEVNCAAIPEELIESELFGHVKGSFTGAHTHKRGKFDQADGGILFLDEIGDMSLKTQAKILRILQEQKFERVGGQKTFEVNVRVLAATNKDLEQEISEGTFRADLFYRLNVVPIRVPSLDERVDDIPLLVADLLTQLYEKGLPRKTFSSEALQAMMNSRWPGNVRELRNFIERLCIMCPEENIDVGHVTPFLDGAAPQPEVGTAGNTLMLVGDFKEARRLFERDYLAAKLAENQGNISKTAELIGLERSHLHKKLKTLEIIE
ncbi:MAG: sigma-54-dependent Fis family transcriptional regulator [Desulfofustis sp. PB-SRB1]|jgi:two-component system nitrogen regulation response regulator NtrX|nr:sigma-54-dependent Fis family transcriptional regulator [Desulfofustis sp. PB-SRB1]MBM1001277.1 sigma-54-dependent Fis family transcriptional regulator [Desulfofustis sp. PB-SRB1]HBH29182.1 sigma-54-dependent Fis family transcriptional regulator [Desulfofustis sp.]